MVKKEEFELELWPWLEAQCPRQYQYFTWYTRNKMKETPSYGFRRDTMRDVQDIPGHLGLRDSGGECRRECQRRMKLAPSEGATLGMTHFLVEDTSGGRHWANTALPYDIQRHPWLCDWQGLATMKPPANGALQKRRGRQKGTIMVSAGVVGGESSGPVLNWSIGAADPCAPQW